jgi:hypothetical protein
LRIGSGQLSASAASDTGNVSSGLLDTGWTGAKVGNEGALGA